MRANPVKVTVSDAVTGEELESKVIADDYIIVCEGRRYVHYTQRMGSTHMVCIKLAPTATSEPAPSGDRASGRGEEGDGDA